MQFGKATWMGSWWKLTPSQKQNIEHIRTLNGDTDDVQVEYEFVDPRQARPKQRALFFALLGDIHQWSGEPTDWLKEYFYTRYTVKTAGGEISLADDTKNTVSDAIKLIDDVIDFIFEFGVPVQGSYTLLPRDEENFIYQCLIHNKCVICGKHVNLYHADSFTIGKKVDYPKERLYPLCGFHQQEIEELNKRGFEKKYHVHVKGIKPSLEILRKLGVKDKYGRNMVPN